MKTLWISHRVFIGLDGVYMHAPACHTAHQVGTGRVSFAFVYMDSKRNGVWHVVVLHSRGDLPLFQVLQLRLAV